MRSPRFLASVLVALTTAAAGIWAIVPGSEPAVGGDEPRPARVEAPTQTPAPDPFMTPPDRPPEKAPAEKQGDSGEPKPAPGTSAAPSPPAPESSPKDETRIMNERHVLVGDDRPLPPDLRTGKKAILEALEETTTLHFVETPLADVVRFLEGKHKVLIVLDRKALDDVGIGSDTPINVDLRNIALRSALKIMLRELDLTWNIRNDVLLITTPEQAETWMVTEVYDVGDLVTCRDSKGKLWDDYDTLMKTIQSTIGPTTWYDVGGPGSMRGVTFPSTKVLVISQTDEVHREIAALFERIRGIARGDKEPPLRDRPPDPKSSFNSSWRTHCGPFAVGSAGMGGDWRPSACEIEGFGIGCFRIRQQPPLPGSKTQ
jgi:hypothetical protein